MKRLICAAVLTAIATPTLAADNFTTWRIKGSQITSVALLEQEVEDPAAMQINLTKLTDEPREPIIVESDMGLETCFNWAQSSVNNDQVTLEITQWNTAYTLNGVVVTSCFAYGTH
ncbi:MAG: hypothetical protein AAFO77_15240 [Pseudomonadota bacterium]